MPSWIDFPAGESNTVCGAPCVELTSTKLDFIAIHHLCCIRQYPQEQDWLTSSCSNSIHSSVSPNHTWSPTVGLNTTIYISWLTKVSSHTSCAPGSGSDRNPCCRIFESIASHDVWLRGPVARELPPKMIFAPLISHRVTILMSPGLKQTAVSARMSRHFPYVWMWSKDNRTFVTFLDYFHTYHMQIIIGTASFLYLDPFIRCWFLSLYYYIVISLISCMIQSVSNSSVQYWSPQVWLSSVDAHWPCIAILPFIWHSSIYAVLLGHLDLRSEFLWQSYHQTQIQELHKLFNFPVSPSLIAA